MKVFALLPLFILLTTGGAVAQPGYSIAHARPATKVIVLAPGQTLYRNVDSRVTIIKAASMPQMKHHKKMARHDHRAPATINVIND